MKRAILVAVVLGFTFAGTAQAQRPGPPPCGPQSQLPADFSKNVAPTARCFEIRMYTANAAEGGDINTLHQRFREEEVSIFEKHGADVIAVWQRLDDPNTLVWMLAYRDLEHRQDVWQKFAADPAWDALLAKYPVPISAEVYYMSPTDYSNLK